MELDVGSVAIALAHPAVKEGLCARLFLPGDTTRVSHRRDMCREVEHARTMNCRCGAGRWPCGRLGTSFLHSRDGTRLAFMVPPVTV